MEAKAGSSTARFGTTTATRQSGPGFVWSENAGVSTERF